MDRKLSDGRNSRRCIKTSCEARVYTLDDSHEIGHAEIDCARIDCSQMSPALKSDRLLTSSNIDPLSWGDAPNAGGFDPTSSGQPGTTQEMQRCEDPASHDQEDYVLHELQVAQTASAGSQLNTMNGSSHYRQSAHHSLQNEMPPVESDSHNHSVPVNGMNSCGVYSGQPSTGFHDHATQGCPATSYEGGFGQTSSYFSHQQDRNGVHANFNAAPDARMTYSVNVHGAPPCDINNYYHTQQRQAYASTSDGVFSAQNGGDPVHQQGPHSVHMITEAVPNLTGSQLPPAQQSAYPPWRSSEEPVSSNPPHKNSEATAPGKTTDICPICGERATGKHYGIDCCDGCKSFFRRAIRNNRTFKCDRAGKCDLTKKPLSRCRQCRLTKCLQAGMKREFVQDERDKLWRRRGKPLGPGVEETSSASETPRPTVYATVASLKDVSDFLRSLGPGLNEWCRKLQEFSSLSMEDQNLLIHNHGGANLLIEIAANSIRSYPHVMMGERFIINQEHSAPTGYLGSMIRRNILLPLIEAKPNDHELCLIKLFILYDPSLPWIVDRSLVMQTQEAIFRQLREHIKIKYQPYQEVEARQRLLQICGVIDGLTETACHLSLILAEARPSQQCG